MRMIPSYSAVLSKTTQRCNSTAWSHVLRPYVEALQYGRTPFIVCYTIIQTQICNNASTIRCMQAPENPHRKSDRQLLRSQTYKCPVNQFKLTRLGLCIQRCCISLARSSLYKSNCSADRCFESLKPKCGIIWHLSNACLPCAPLVVLVPRYIDLWMFGRMID